MTRTSRRAALCCVWVVIGCLTTVALSAQDPLLTLPDNYTLQFDNDLVRVVRVHYGPGEKLPPHIHPSGLTMYVYLNDAGSVAFSHETSGGTFTNSRAAVQAGSFAVAFSFEELHAVENMALVPSDFLRIQIKTGVAEELAGRLLRTRVPRPQYAVGQKDQPFVHDRFVVTRQFVAAGQSMAIGGADPALLISIPSGETRWLPAGPMGIDERIDNTGGSPMEFLRLAVKAP